MFSIPIQELPSFWIVCHQATLDISGVVVVVANLHTVDGQGRHDIPSSTRDVFLPVALGNVLGLCAATPELRDSADGIWVACGDTNMSIVDVGKVVKKLPGKLIMVSGPSEKSDFIISSGQVVKYKQRLFLANDNMHWAVAAHLSLGVHSDTSEVDICQVFAATQDLRAAAKSAAAMHVEEQRQISAFADLAQEDEARDAELAEIKQNALQQTQQQQVIIDASGFASSASLAIIRISFGSV